MVHSTRMVHATPNIFSVPEMQNRRPYRTSRTCQESQSQGMCVCVHALAKHVPEMRRHRELCTEIQEQNRKIKKWQILKNDKEAVSNARISESFHISLIVPQDILQLNLSYNHSSHQILNVFSQAQEIFSVFQYSCERIRVLALAQSLAHVSI